MEFFATLLFIGMCIYVSHKDEWRSNNRLTPPGYHLDRMQATDDIRRYGKHYYYQAHIAGKYDVKDE